jgi:hypothetical protein
MDLCVKRLTYQTTHIDGYSFMFLLYKFTNTVNNTKEDNLKRALPDSKTLFQQSNALEIHICLKLLCVRYTLKVKFKFFNEQQAK